jgi:hypothetical protein
MAGSSEQSAQVGPAVLVALGLAVVVFLVAGVWGMVVFFKVLGEVHGFSALRAFAATLLGTLAIYGLMLLAVLAVFALLLALGGFPVPS